LLVSGPCGTLWPVLAAINWLDTTGAAIVLTGVVTVAATAIPTLLKPWTDKRADKRNRAEDWRDQAKTLCVDLEEHLRRMKRPRLQTIPTIAMAYWGDQNELRPRARGIMRFAPTDELRSLGDGVLVTLEALQQEADELFRVTGKAWPPDGQAIREKENADAAQSYDAKYGPADDALRAFEKALIELG